MKLQINSNKKVEYLIEDGRGYIDEGLYIYDYFITLSTPIEHSKINKVTSKDVELRVYNKELNIYYFKKTDKDITIDVDVIESYYINIYNNYHESYNEFYNLKYKEAIQLVIEDYISGHLLKKITIKDNDGNLVDPKLFKFSNYKKSIRHYIDLKMPPYDLNIYLDYEEDIEDKFCYDTGESALSEEDYNDLFKDLIYEFKKWATGSFYFFVIIFFNCVKWFIS